MKFRIYFSQAAGFPGQVPESYPRKIRIQDILETYRREGANRRALEKERAKLDALDDTDLEVLHAAMKRSGGRQRWEEV
jgi:hypothetical protein